jgi:hypothetical protein
MAYLNNDIAQNFIKDAFSMLNLKPSNIFDKNKKGKKKE